jgi:hypothetical protein
VQLKALLDICTHTGAAQALVHRHIQVQQKAYVDRHAQVQHKLLYIDTTDASKSSCKRICISAAQAIVHRHHRHAQKLRQVQ